jgi:hypothetical protein
MMLHNRFNGGRENKPRTQSTLSRFMTKKEALYQFRINLGVVKGDPIYTRENWNNFTDTLCKGRKITMKQYETWTNPF